MGRNISSTPDNYHTPISGKFGTGQFRLISSTVDFTVPATSLRVRCFGSGAEAGGAFAMSVLTGLTVGSTVTCTVGLGSNTSFGAHVIAASAAAAVAGSSASSTGDIKYSGGTGSGGSVANLFGAGSAAGVSGTSGGGGLGSSANFATTSVASSGPTAGGDGMSGTGGTPHIINVVSTTVRPAIPGRLPEITISGVMPIDYIGTGPGGAGGAYDSTNNIYFPAQGGINGGGGGGGSSGICGSGGFPGGGRGGSANATSGRGLIVIEW